MKFGIGIPTCREGQALPTPMVTPASLQKMALEADRLGLDYLWADDFRVPSPDMHIPYPTPPNWYEVLVSLAYMARITTRIRIGTGVMVLPLREPVLLAKQAATLDHLSNGRLFLGVGLGVSRDEFVSLNPKNPKANRGKIVDEVLEALEILLYSNLASYKGEYFEFNNISIYPKPVQKHIPLYFVSLEQDTSHNLDRLSQMGQGVLVSSNPVKAQERIKLISEVLVKAGRKPSEVDFGSYGVMSIAKTRQEALAQYQVNRVSHRTKGWTDEQVMARHYIGTPAEVIEKIGKLKEAGITQCVVNQFPVDSMDGMVEHLRRYGEQILPAFKK